MNSTHNGTLLSTLTCSLPDRVYTSFYLFFKLINSTYLRFLIGPAILLNTLCLIVFSRPRLSSKSTTIVFLRFLALFDMLAITLKYIRSEINYQSTEKGHQIFLLIPAVCKALYVLMNASISISMWTIVLMSLDKAVAVSYPLKSSIWVTQRRAFYICCFTIIILLSANLSFINLSGIGSSRNFRKYCGLTEESFIVDLLTASILPMGLITATNIIIAVVLRRISRISLDWPTSDEKNVIRDSDPNFLNHQLSTPSVQYRTSACSTPPSVDLRLATKRRTSAQVTRMLLAVTLTLIICNIPNTIFFVFVKIYDTRQLLFGRLCTDISDKDINLYKFGFYSSVTQDILSDLPHIVNFFLYCLAGKKFRSIFVNEVQYFLLELHLIERRPRSFTNGTFVLPSALPTSTGINPRKTCVAPKVRESVDVLYNGTTTETVLTHQKKNRSRLMNNRYSAHQKNVRSYSNIQ